MPLVIALEDADDFKIRAIVYQGQMQNPPPHYKDQNRQVFRGVVWNVLEGRDVTKLIQDMLYLSQDVTGVLCPGNMGYVDFPDELSVSEAVEVIYADLIRNQFRKPVLYPNDSEVFIYLQRKDRTWVLTNRITHRLCRVKTLQSLKAPRWIIKYEQILTLWTRTGQERPDLVEKYVDPILGIGSITVPDFERKN